MVSITILRLLRWLYVLHNLVMTGSRVALKDLDLSLKVEVFLLQELNSDLLRVD